MPTSITAPRARGPSRRSAGTSAAGSPMSARTNRIDGGRRPAATCSRRAAAIAGVLEIGADVRERVSRPRVPLADRLAPPDRVLDEHLCTGSRCRRRTGPARRSRASNVARFASWLAATFASRADVDRRRAPRSQNPRQRGQVRVVGLDDPERARPALEAAPPSGGELARPARSSRPRHTWPPRASARAGGERGEPSRLDRGRRRAAPGPGRRRAGRAPAAPGGSRARCPPGSRPTPAAVGRGGDARGDPNTSPSRASSARLATERPASTARQIGRPIRAAAAAARPTPGARSAPAPTRCPRAGAHEVAAGEQERQISGSSSRGTARTPATSRAAHPVVDERRQHVAEQPQVGRGGDRRGPDTWRTTARRPRSPRRARLEPVGALTTRGAVGEEVRNPVPEPGPTPPATGTASRPSCARPRSRRWARAPATRDRRPRPVVRAIPRRRTWPRDLPEHPRPTASAARRSEPARAAAPTCRPSARATPAWPWRSGPPGPSCRRPCGCR